MDANWIGAIAGVLGVLATIGTAYLARPSAKRRGGRLPQTSQDHGPYDVFLSYADADAAWAGEFADTLRGHGLRVFHDADLGEVRRVAKGEGMRASANFVLVFSRAAMAQSDIGEDDYAAILDRVHEAGKRFIPVLIENVPRLPAFAQIRKPLDLRGLTRGASDREIARLAELLRSA